MRNRDYIGDYSRKLAKARAELLELRRLRQRRIMWPSPSRIRALLGEARLCKRVIRYVTARTALG